jgi:hypothetical protein
MRDSEQSAAKNTRTFKMSEPETVFVCYEWEPTQRNHYHATGEWVVCGVVEEEQNAELWTENHNEDQRKYAEMTLNVVEAFYTK